MKKVFSLPQFSFVMGLAAGFAALSFQVIRYSSGGGANQPMRAVSVKSAARPGTSHGAAAPIRSSGPPPPEDRENRQTQEASPWTVPYGKEFWRSAVKQHKSAAAQRTQAPFDLDEVIERVSNAFTQQPDCVGVEAKAYSAALNREELRFAPHPATA